MGVEKYLVLWGVVFLFSMRVDAVLRTEVSENAYISIDGYDIAWAGPCAVIEPSCGALDFSYQAQFGWRAMDSHLFSELMFSVENFVFAGANVDYHSGNNLDESSGARVLAAESTTGLSLPINDVAVATPWFSSFYNHVDWRDGLYSNWSFADLPGMAWSDSIAVRETHRRIPEPFSMALIGVGLLGLSMSRRSRQHAVT